MKIGTNAHSLKYICQYSLPPIHHYINLLEIFLRLVRKSYSFPSIVFTGLDNVETYPFPPIFFIFWRSLTQAEASER